MKIWISGASGFIGTHLRLAVQEHGWTVRGFDLKAGQGPGAVQVGDLRTLSDADWDAQLAGQDVVFHLAATVSIPACQKDPVASENNNVGVTLRLLEALRRQKERQGFCAKLFFASSAALYGARGDDGRRLLETDVPDRFLSFYAAQKFASEQLLHQYALAFQIPTLSFRFFNVYGPGQDPTSPYSGVLSRFVHFLNEGQPLVLQGGGQAIRDFIHVRDIAEALAQAVGFDAAQMQGQAVNLAAGQSVSVREVAAEVQKVVQGKHPKLWPGMTDAPAREGDVRVSTADIERARQLFNFQPRVSLAEGLAELFG